MKFNQDQVMSLIRSLLKAGGGALAANGINQSSVTQMITGIITALIGAIWSHNFHADDGSGGTSRVAGDSGSKPTVPPGVKLMLLLLLPAALIFGCQTKLAPGGAYSSPDTNGVTLGPFIFWVDKTLVDSKDTMIAFLGWESRNRGQLPTGVTRAADAIRTDAPLWFTNAWVLRSNYLWIRVNLPSQAPQASNALQSAASQLGSQATSSKTIQDTTATATH